MTKPDALERTIHIDKDFFIQCVENLGLTRIPSIAALFGKSTPIAYKYMSPDSDTQIPNAVVKHLITLASITDEHKQRQILEASISEPLPKDIDGIKPYADILKSHGYRPNAENIAAFFGKSTASIHRAKAQGGQHHDSALAAHLRTLRMLTKAEQKLVLDECFNPKNVPELEEA